MNQGLLQSVTTSQSRKFCSFLDGIGKNWSEKNSGYRHTMSYCPLERYVYVPPVQCIPPEPSVFHPTKKGNFLRGTFIFLWNSGWPGWGQLPSHKSVAIVYFVLLNLLVDLLLIRILVLVRLPSRISLGKFILPNNTLRPRDLQCEFEICSRQVFRNLVAQ